MYKTKAGKISKRFVPKGSEIMLILLGYSNWEEYRKHNKLLFLSSKERLTNEINQLDLSKEKNISLVLKKLNLTINFTMDIIDKIRKRHFEEGASMVKIARDLESDLKKLGWLVPNVYRIYRKKYKTPVFKKGVSRFLYHILGYMSFEDYQKNQRKLYIKARNKIRRETGFTQKKKVEIRNIHQNKCMICKSESNLHVHHLDKNPENNEEANLKTLCKDCHIKVGKGYYKYNKETDSFEEEVFYHISRRNNKIQIKSFYNKELIRIIKSLYPKYRSFKKTEKYWLLDLKAFQFIKMELLDYIKSTKKKYEIQGDINFERNDKISKLRTIQNYNCYKCGIKLYDIDFNVPIRKWSQKCWGCGKETPIVTYILEDEGLGDCVIGSHIEIDLILQSEYKFVDRKYSHTMKQNTIGNLCIHCGKYQGSGFIEHELVWDAPLYSYDDSYEKYFPVDRILSIGHIIYLDQNEKNKESHNKSHNIIIEKIYFNREIISKFSLEIIKELDKLIEHLSPDKFNTSRRNYLYFIKAMIYMNHSKLKEAKRVLEKFFKQINEEEIYTIYVDINDLYLDILAKF